MIMINLTQAKNQKSVWFTIFFFFIHSFIHQLFAYYTFQSADMKLTSSFFSSSSGMHLGIDIIIEQQGRAGGRADDRSVVVLCVCSIEIIPTITMFVFNLFDFF